MKKIVFLVSLISLLFSESITIMTEVFPPFQIVNEGELTGGISVEIVRAIQKEVGNNSKIKVYPWSRGMKLLEKRKNYALFSTLRTKQRENKFKWVGPLAKMELVFFKKTNSKIKINSIDDAKKVSKIGVTNKVANYDILKAMGFKNLDVIKSGVDVKNIKKLIKGRIDLWPALKSTGIYNAKIMGYAGKIEPIDNVTIFEGDLYIAFNKNTDDKIIKKWQSALDKLKENGTIKEIIKRYK